MGDMLNKNFWGGGYQKKNQTSYKGERKYSKSTFFKSRKCFIPKVSFNFVYHFIDTKSFHQDSYGFRNLMSSLEWR